MCAFLTVGCPVLSVNMDAVSFQDHVALVGRWMDTARWWNCRYGNVPPSALQIPLELNFVQLNVHSGGQ
jgi:hypothetical protein